VTEMWERCGMRDYSSVRQNWADRKKGVGWKGNGKMLEEGCREVVKVEGNGKMLEGRGGEVIIVEDMGKCCKREEEK